MRLSEKSDKITFSEFFLAWVGSSPGGLKLKLDLPSLYVSGIHCSSLIYLILIERVYHRIFNLYKDQTITSFKCNKKIFFTRFYEIKIAQKSYF